MAKGFYHYAFLKDYDSAVGYYEQARQFLPNSSRIPESLAYVARKLGQWDLRESHFNEAERLDPLDVSLLTQYALSYVALRRFPEALRKLDQVLDITPDDPRYPCAKGGYRTSRGRSAAGLRRSSLPSTRAADDTQVVEGGKFTKRSWSVALHKSSLG